MTIRRIKMKYGLLVLMLQWGVSFMYGGTIEIFSNKEEAFIYIDNVKKSMISNGMRTMTLPAGTYKIKLVKALDDKWQEIAEQRVHVDDTQITKVTFAHFKIVSKPKTSMKKEKHTHKNKRFKRVGETVVNSQSGLMWQDNTDSTSNEKTWQEAQQYCDALTLSGYDNWRLPTAQELLTVIEYHGESSELVDTFKHLAVGFYWSSSQPKDEPLNASRVYLDLGCTDGMPKDDIYKVKCVRE